MAGSGEHERIEIELTSHDPAAGELPTSAEPNDAETMVSEEAEPSSGARRFGVVALAIAAVGALIVGFVVGRASDDSTATVGSVPDEATADSTVPTTTIDRAFEALDTLPPVPAPTTTQPRVIVTEPGAGDGSRTQSEPFDAGVHESLLGLPIEIVASSWEGRSFAVDLGSGQARYLDGGERLNGVNNVAVGETWAAFSSFDWQSGFRIVHDDGTVAEATGVHRPVITNDAGDGMWVGSDPNGPPTADMVEISTLGEPTGRRIDLQGGVVVAADPAGGLLVRGVGGDNTVAVEGARRLTTGVVLGIGAGVLVAEECDDARQCEVIAIDRDTGEATPVVMPSDWGSALFGFALFGGTMTPMDPSETKFIVLSQGDAAFPDEWVPPVASLVDLTTGESIEIGQVENVGTMRWSPDGRLIFWAGRGVLEAFNVETGESVEVTSTFSNVGLFDIRVKLPSVDPASTLPAPVDELLPRIEQVSVDATVGAASIEIIAKHQDHRWTSLDVTTGEQTTFDRRTQPPWAREVLVGSDWVAGSMPGGEHPVLLSRDGGRFEVEVEARWPVVPSATDGFWAATTSLRSADAEMFEFQSDGTPTGQSIQTPNVAVFDADPAGGLIASAADGVYQLMPDSAARLTTGVLLGIDDRRVVAYECDDSLVCQLVVIDRSTDERSSVEFDDVPSADTWSNFWVRPSLALSPDGSALAVASLRPSGDTMRLFLEIIDVDTGQTQQLGALARSAHVAWINNGEQLLWRNGQRVMSYDVALGVSFLVSNGLEDVTAFAVRQTAP